MEGKGEKMGGMKGREGRSREKRWMCPTFSSYPPVPSNDINGDHTKGGANKPVCELSVLLLLHLHQFQNKLPLYAFVYRTGLSCNHNSDYRSPISSQLVHCIVHELSFFRNYLNKSKPQMQIPHQLNFVNEILARAYNKKLS